MIIDILGYVASLGLKESRGKQLANFLLEQDEKMKLLQSTIDDKNKEIERLKGLIEDAHNSGWRRGYSLHTEIGESLQQFKSENNL